MALAWNAPTPFELIRWSLAEKFGWTLDYIDGLPLKELHDYFRIQDGRAKANNGSMLNGNQSRVAVR